MEKFTTLTAVAAPLLRDNVDTDQIIPSREMRSVSKTGLAAGLFAGWRYRTIGGREQNPDFVLNQAPYREAKILLSGENFGCGSSREHAAWALKEYGIRSIIAPSFNPIFEGNCVRNGIAPVKLAAAAIAKLAAANSNNSKPPTITVDLDLQQVKAPGLDAFSFDMASEAKAMLLLGLDAIDLTMTKAAEIAAFIAHDRAARAWAYL